MRRPTPKTTTNRITQRNAAMPKRRRKSVDAGEGERSRPVGMWGSEFCVGSFFIGGLKVAQSRHCARGVVKLQGKCSNFNGRQARMPVATCAGFCHLAAFCGRRGKI